MKKIAFTLVLNGDPFIKKQAEIIPEIFDIWYIVEGATLPTKDTAWCRNIDNRFYTDKKLSVDGTSEFLDSIASDKIKIIRKNDFWDGKVEMCNSFMKDVEDCILMEFDVDEIWDKEVLKDVLEYCENNQGFDGIQFKCNYLVGPDLVIENDNCYGNRGDEWSRLWIVKDKTYWVSHEPPRLKGMKQFLNREFSKNKGWVFDHFAYVLPEQLKFKENFYGYVGAYQCWLKLQNHKNFPAKLNEFLPWVDNTAIVNKRIRKSKNNMVLVAHYNEDLSWLNGLKTNVTVYSKTNVDYIFTKNPIEPKREYSEIFK